MNYMKGTTDISRNTSSKYSTELFQMALSSYSNFIIKLNENTVNTNVRKLYGASLRYIPMRYE